MAVVRLKSETMYGFLQKLMKAFVSDKGPWRFCSDWAQFGQQGVKLITHRGSGQIEATVNHSKEKSIKISDTIVEVGVKCRRDGSVAEHRAGKEHVTVVNNCENISGTLVNYVTEYIQRKGNIKVRLRKNRELESTGEGLCGITFRIDVVINGFDNGLTRSFRADALASQLHKGASFWVATRAVVLIDAASVQVGLPVNAKPRGNREDVRRR